MPTVLPAATALFGVQGAVSNVQSKSINTRFDRKDASDSTGEPIAMAFHGKSAEHTLEILGENAAAYSMGAAATAPASITAAVGGGIFCVDEAAVDMVNDNFVRSTIRVTEYLIED